MKHALASLAFTLLCVGAATAQSITEIKRSDAPEISRLMDNPARLYPNGSIARDRSLGIDKAYYENVTTRYGHNIFRTSNEYTTLAVEIGAKVYRVALESDVFEDTYPLIYDLDRDGRGEIITIQSSMSGGGSLAVYSVRDGALAKIAQTPNIGTRNRWMNVAGIADFNGDGIIEIALVDRPHIRGELEFWNYKSDTQTFELRTSSLGFSNHFIGSNAQRLSALVQLGGKTLLALPSTNRRALELVDASGEAIQVIARKELASPIADNFAVSSEVPNTIGLILADDSRVILKIADD